VTSPGTNERPDALWRLRLSQERRDGLLVVTAEGRLGFADAPRLSSALAEAIAAGDRRILVDLKGLDYISSAGVMALEAAVARLWMEQGELTLSGLTPPVRLALELAGFPADVPLLP
jgi:anti-anti-sigma factor